MEEKITTEELDTADKKDQKFNILNYVKQYKKMILVIVCAVIAAIALLIGVISIANSIKAGKIEKQLQGMVFKHYSEYNVDSGENSVTNWYLWVIDIDKDDSYISEDWSCYPAESEDKRFKHSKDEYELDISFSLFGKPQLGRYEIVYDENGEIEALDSGIVRYDAVAEESSESVIGKKAFEVFGKLTKWKNSNFAEMIKTIYKDYDVNYEAVEGSDSKFLVTVTGNYYPNKTDLKNFTQEGTFTVEVDLATNEGKIIKDQGITSAYDVYRALSTKWYY